MAEREKVDELYSIMGELQEIKYNQESLLAVLEMLESAYSQESQREGKLVSNTAKFYLSALQGELGTAINRLDLYILGEARKNQGL